MAQLQMLYSKWLDQDLVGWIQIIQSSITHYMILVQLVQFMCSRHSYSNNSINYFHCKNSRPCRDLNPVPIQYQANMLPTDYHGLDNHYKWPFELFRRLLPILLFINSVILPHTSNPYFCNLDWDWRERNQLVWRSETTSQYGQISLQQRKSIPGKLDH